MTAMLRTARRLLADESGATAIEYALLAALIAGVIMAAMLTSVGTTLSATLQPTTNDRSDHLHAGHRAMTSRDRLSNR